MASILFRATQLLSLVAILEGGRIKKEGTEGATLTATNGEAAMLEEGKTSETCTWWTRTIVKGQQYTPPGEDRCLQMLVKGEHESTGTGRFRRTVAYKKSGFTEPCKKENFQHSPCKTLGYANGPSMTTELDHDMKYEVFAYLKTNEAGDANSMCTTKEETQCAGNDLQLSSQPLSVLNHQVCCNQCSTTAGCTAWSWNSGGNKLCYLKSSCPKPTPMEGVVSGWPFSDAEKKADAGQCEKACADARQGCDGFARAIIYKATRSIAIHSKRCNDRKRKVQECECEKRVQECACE